MVEAWTWPAYVGLLAGSMTFAALLIPLLVWQIRGYGKLSLARVVGAAAVAIYGTALVAYTLLPLPRGDWCAVNVSPAAELVPLHSIGTIRTATAGEGLRASMTDIATLQVVFNVALFIPWGVLARQFFGMRLGWAALSGLVASTVIELTQYTGVWGLVGCAYRVADIDDVIANSLGAIIGASIAPLVLFWMPRASVLAAERGTARPITRRRRLGAMVVDVTLLWALAGTLAVLYRLFARYVVGDLLPTESSWSYQFAPFIAASILVIILPALAPPGGSPGQRLLWLAPRWEGRYSRPRALARALSAMGVYALLSAVSLVPHGRYADEFSAAAAIWALVCLASAMVTTDRRGLSFRLTGATVVDVRERPAKPPSQAVGAIGDDRLPRSGHGDG